MLECANADASARDGGHQIQRRKHQKKFSTFFEILLVAPMGIEFLRHNALLWAVSQYFFFPRENSRVRA
jgi:hypothetical protein